MSETTSTPISELFHRDPLLLTDQDLDALIAHYRNLRAQAQAQPAKTKSKAKASDLGDIDL